jgi:hypothetical protein
LSPSNAVLSPTADLNSCSNFAWSVAVMNDNRMPGIPFDLFRPVVDVCEAAAAPVLKLWAI